MKVRRGTWARHVVTVSLVTLISLGSMLAAQAEEPPTFAVKWGSQGAGDRQFDDAQRLAVDGAGNVWVADYGNTRIQKFSPTGTLLLKFTTGDIAYSPLSLAVNAAGEFYITTWWGVSKYASTGTRLLTWGDFQGIGSDDDQFKLKWSGLSRQKSGAFKLPSLPPLSL